MNFLKGISDKKLRDSETKLLAYSGLNPDEYQIMEVGIGNGNSIHTFVCGKGPTLVMVHGYGASGMFFYKLFKDLSKHFKIYSIDLLGMGSSSRPNFSAVNVAGAESFFIESIELWRQAVGLDEFFLAGHSFGGYMSSLYALKFPQHILKLLLISPVGVSKKPADFTTQEVFNRIKSKGRKMMFKTFYWLWNKNVTPFSVLRYSGGLIAPSLMKVYTRKRFPTIVGDELLALENHIYQIAMKKGSGEYALNIILEPGAYAREPLEDRLMGLQVPVTFFYGDGDWTDCTSAINLVSKSKIVANVEIVMDCGHHLYFDNPTGLVGSILKSLEIYRAEDQEVDEELYSNLTDHLS